MKYKDAKDKAIRFVKEGNGQLANSVINQVRLHEGDRAAKELVREASSKGIEERGKKYFS